MITKRQSRKLAGFTIAGALTMAGCSTPQTSPTPAAENGTDRLNPTPPVALEQGRNAFGVDLYRRLAETGGNVVFSPTSIVEAFGLVQPGARGDTAAQIGRTLRLVSGDAPTTASLDQPGRRVAIGNSVWMQQRFPLNPEYRRIVTTRSGMAPRLLDFANAQGSAATINRWVEERTAGKIKELVKPSSIEPDTALILVNTVYLKADWAVPFDVSDTRNGPFQVATGRTVTVPFMQQSTRLGMLETRSFQALALPYRGEELTMVLFLPRSTDGLAVFEQGLTAAKLEGWMADLRAAEPQWVDVQIPKLELATRYELPEVLRRMGMVLPFTDQADLSGITSAGPLKIDDVVHQATLTVDERGTEASAATSVQIRVTSAAPIAKPFRADHPFFMAIRDNRSGDLLFMGRIADPSAR